VDLRKDSSSYLKAFGVELSEEKVNAVYIPKGCAHAYLTLTDGCIIGYKVDAIYCAAMRRRHKVERPGSSLRWPSGPAPLISDKDARWPLLKEWPNPF